jgi:hypothetical protein
MKLCKDCKHLVGDGVCIRRVPIEGIDYVYGGDTKSLCRYAQDERTIAKFDKSEFCGPDAKYFESKEVK